MCFHLLKRNKNNSSLLNIFQKATIERTLPNKESRDIRIKINGIPVDSESLMFRGCNLCHTQMACALVVYSGSDTSVMLNSSVVRTKRSRIDDNADKILYYLILLAHLITLLICVLSIGKEIKDNFLVFYIKTVLMVHFITPLSLYAAKIVMQGLQVIQMIKVILF